MFPINWFQIALGALPALALAWLLHTVDVDRLERRQALAVSAQAVADRAGCDKDKAITKGVSHDLQTKIDALATRLADARRVQPARCVPVHAADAARGGDAAAGAGGYAGADAVDAGALISFAGEAEKYRLQLIGCQDFIRQTWAAKGQ